MNRSPYRVGIDVVDIAEIALSIEQFGERFLQRIFTPQEQAYCHSLASNQAQSQSFAVRFAAKEATIKVLRPEQFMLNWLNIEIYRMPEGWCEIHLHHDAAELARRRNISALSLSMSHEKNMATAIVVADILSPL